VYISVFILMCVCVCVWVSVPFCDPPKNESDNKDNIFVIEKFTAGYICASCRFVVVGFGSGSAPQPPKVCYATEHSIAKKKKNK